MKLHIENIFLFDGLGALFSLLGVGFVFPYFSVQLGIPSEHFYLMAVFPLIYSIYSLSCHFFVSQKKIWMLKLIMCANLIYCLLALSIFFKSNDITGWGYALIVSEIVIILGVVFIEYKVCKNINY